MHTRSTRTSSAKPGGSSVGWRVDGRYRRRVTAATRPDGDRQDRRAWIESFASRPRVTRELLPMRFCLSATRADRGR